MPLTYSQWIWGFEVFNDTVSTGSFQHTENDMVPIYRSAIAWAASTGYSAGITIAPAGASASSCQLWKCTTSGTSNTSEPSWPASPTPNVTTVSDNNVVWTFIGFNAVPTGVYTPDEFATQVQTVLNTADPANNYAVSFSFSTLKFTISGTSAFELRLANGSNCAGLLGFASSNQTGQNSYQGAAAGTSPSTAHLWTAAEPLNATSPVSAQAGGAAAALTNRVVNTLQNVSDGATVESIYVATLRLARIAFRALSTTEQTNMESFLDWATQGKRFTWQPDKTSTNFLKLVMANPGQINNMFEWLTRSETSYGVLTFLEQTS